jgi:hypothetical protein
VSRMSSSQWALLYIWLLAFATSMLLVTHIWWSVHIPNPPAGFYAEIKDLGEQPAGLYAFVLTTMLGVGYARTQAPVTNPKIPFRDQLTAEFLTAVVISIAWNAVPIFFLWKVSHWGAEPGREMDIKSLREVLGWFPKLVWVVNPFIAFYFAHDHDSK